MSYIGVQPTAGQYRKLDNISSGFNGSTTSFTTSVGGTNVTAGTAQQLLVSLGGVIQQPDTDYTVSTNTITFTTAPTSGLSFFAVLMGDALNTVTTSDGAITTAKLAGNLSVGLAAGTASAPSLYFTGDTNTGVYSLGADQVAISTGGTGRLFVDSSGRVGIGTSSPASIFHVSGSADQTYTLQTTTAGADNRINFRNSAGTDAGGIWYMHGGNHLLFNTGGSNQEKARIDGSGRLLVGTSSSRGNTFNGTGNDCNFQLEGTTFGGSSASFIRNSNNSSQPYLVLGKTRGTAVGGTTIVNASDSLGTISFQGSDGTELVEAASITAAVDGTPGANDMPGALVFSTTADGASSPTERMSISANGSISTPATATANHSFGVNNSGNLIANLVNAGSSTPYGVLISFSAASPNDTTRYFLSCSDSTTIRATIRSNGGLANFQANNVNLSDRNTKKDISPAADTWDCIKEWEIVNYRYKDQPDDADLNLGVIAQQVAESCPEVITVFQEAKEATEDQPAQEERLGIKEQQMYWMAIKALQEAQVRIEQLETKVAALESD